MSYSKYLFGALKMLSLVWEEEKEDKGASFVLPVQLVQKKEQENEHAVEERRNKTTYLTKCKTVNS